MQITEQSVVMLLKIAEESLRLSDGGMVFSYSKDTREELINRVYAGMNYFVQSPAPAVRPADTEEKS